MNININSPIFLNNGIPMPMIGITLEKVKQDLKQYISTSYKNGCRFFDCGNSPDNFREIGEVLSGLIPQVIKREEIFICVKLYITEYDALEVETSVKYTLEKLKLEYIDLIVIQCPLYFRLKSKEKTETANMSPSVYSRINMDITKWFVPLRNCDYIGYYSEFFQRTWKSMEYCVYKGYTKSIGVCHFSKSKLEDILSICSIPPVVNMIEYHMYYQQKQLHEFCMQQKIFVVSLLPFGYVETFNFNKPPPQYNIISDSNLKAIADSYRMEKYNIVISWLINISIPSLVDYNTSVKNFSKFDQPIVQLDQTDINKLDVFPHYGRFIDFAELGLAPEEQAAVWN